MVYKKVPNYHRASRRNAAQSGVDARNAHPLPTSASRHRPRQFLRALQSSDPVLFGLLRPKLILALGLLFLCPVRLLRAKDPPTLPEPVPISIRGAAGLNQPIAVYNNWSAYDELSDNIELTEELAMKQLG